MKRVAPGLLALVFSLALTQPAIADTITGVVEAGGSNSRTLTGINFVNPGFVFLASGSLGVMDHTDFLTMNNFQYANAPGTLLFDWNHNGVDITMTILTSVIKDNDGFLNLVGTGMVTETGFSATPYDFGLTSTRTGGATSYALTLSTVPEPGSLFLVGSGLLALAGLLFRKLKKPALHC
jgi:hypothetical protein